MTRFPMDPRHAAILAEPEPFEDGSAVNWHVPGHVKGVPLAELPEDKARAVHQVLQELSANIRAYADELDKARRSPTDRSLADALRNAMCVPSSDYIYSVDGQPVLVAWAYRRDTEPPMEVGNVRQIAVDRPKPPAPALSTPPEPRPLPSQPSTASRALPLRDEPPIAIAPTPVATIAVVRAFPWHWLLWLLFALLIAIILALLLRACALNVVNTWFPGLSWCGSNPSITSVDKARIAELQRLIDNLEAQPVPTRVCEAPPRGEISVREIQERVRSRTSEEGELEISLAWNGPADLDLHVKCSDGSTIFFRNKVACGGALKIDLNTSNSRSNDPVEHITFPSVGAIPPGSLTIGVGWFEDHGETRTEIPATIVVKRGSQVQPIRITIPKPASRPGGVVTYHRITVPQ